MAATYSSPMKCSVLCTHYFLDWPKKTLSTSYKTICWDAEAFFVHTKPVAQIPVLGTLSPLPYPSLTPPKPLLTCPQVPSWIRPPILAFPPQCFPLCLRGLPSDYRIQGFTVSTVYSRITLILFTSLKIVAKVLCSLLKLFCLCLIP